jgi:putative transposase
MGVKRTPVQTRRNSVAAKRFFKHVLRSSELLRKIATYQLRNYPTEKADISRLLN